MPAWVDFKELRKQVSFAKLLEHYRVKGKTKGVQFTAPCPLPLHKGDGYGPSFSANLEKGIFQCFGCKAKGNHLDFAALMEGLNPENGDELRKAALLVAERFGISPAGQKEKSSAPEPEKQRESKSGRSGKVVAVNVPLDFELKELDAGHPYLLGRGFNAKTIAHFGLGYCGRGIMKDRVAIPLHNAQGRLVGYAGRVVDDSAITDENPRYRFPSERERGNIVHEFRKSLFIYNGYRITEPVEDLLVVEGFASVWWLPAVGKGAGIPSRRSHLLSQGQISW